MAKSSLNLQQAKSGGLKHNDRSEEKEPEYLLPVEHRLENEVDVSAGIAEQKIKELYAEAKANYEQIHNQKLQAKSYTWEGVVNLNKEHTLEDVQQLVKELEKETGFTSVQIAIHRDEGRVERDTPIYNLHAHLTFFTLDKNGEQLFRRTIKASDRRKIEAELIEEDPTLQKGEPKSEERKAFNKLVQTRRRELGLKVMDTKRMSKLQDITAESLGMERGKKGSTAQRLEPKPYRETVQKVQKIKAKAKAKQKELKSEISELRATLQESGATRADYAELEQLNRDLKQQIKDKDLSYEQLRKEAKEYITKFQAKNKELKSENSELLEKIKELKQEKLELEEIVKKQKEEIEKFLKKHAQPAEETDFEKAMKIVKQDEDSGMYAGEEEYDMSFLLRKKKK